MKPQIKTFRLLILIMSFFTLTMTGAAQSQSPFIYIAEKEVFADSTQIAVRVLDDSQITKIRLSNETDGKATVKDVSVVKSFLIPVELIDGENSFNIVAYKNNKIVYSTDNPIVIVRKSMQETATAAAESVELRTYNRFVTGTGETRTAKTAGGKKLRLSGKGKIKNQATYNLEIDASELPPIVGSYAIEIKNENLNKQIFDYETRKIEYDASTNRHKALQLIELKLREGVNHITVSPRVEGLNLAGVFSEIIVECKDCIDELTPSDSIIIRGIVGLEQVGASSARGEQRPFLSLFFNTPINAGTKLVCPEGAKRKNGKTECTDEQRITKPKLSFSVWGDVRLTTTPVQSIGSLANFTPAVFASNFVQGDSAGKVNDLVRSFDFLVGFDKEIFAPRKIFSGFLRGRTSLSFIAAGGAISPLSSDKGAAFYKVPTDETSQNNINFFKDFPTAKGYKNIAFIAPERDRFFRQYYAGFRLKTFFDNKDVQFHPAMFDVTFGQNEAITTRLKGVIMRLDGSTPLPISKAGFLYLFGSVNMRLGRSRETFPTFFLEPTTGISLTDQTTIVFPIDNLPFQTKDRDVFRIGVGIDVFKLFKKEDAPKSPEK